jgi:hypothetical protein
MSSSDWAVYNFFASQSQHELFLLCPPAPALLEQEGEREGGNGGGGGGECVRAAAATTASQPINIQAKQDSDIDVVLVIY